LAVAATYHPILDTFFIFLGAKPPIAPTSLSGCLVF